MATPTSGTVKDGSESLPSGSLHMTWLGQAMAWLRDRELGSCPERRPKVRSWSQDSSLLKSANQHWKELREGMHDGLGHTSRATSHGTGRPPLLSLFPSSYVSLATY